MPLINEGTGATLFAHSFGVISMTGAARDLVKPARAAAGKAGDGVGIICTSHCLLMGGKSQLEDMREELPSICKSPMYVDLYRSPTSC